MPFVTDLPSHKVAPDFNYQHDYFLDATIYSFLGPLFNEIYSTFLLDENHSYEKV